MRPVAFHEPDAVIARLEAEPLRQAPRAPKRDNGRNVTEQGPPPARAPHRARVAGVSKYGVFNRLGRGIYDLIAIAWYQRRRVHRQQISED